MPDNTISTTIEKRTTNPAGEQQPEARSKVGALVVAITWMGQCKIFLLWLLLSKQLLEHSEQGCIALGVLAGCGLFQVSGAVCMGHDKSKRLGFMPIDPIVSIVHNVTVGLL